MYCSIDDLRARLSEVKLMQLTDDTHSGTINLSVVADAISAAQPEVDATLQAIGEQTPLAAAPEDVPELLRNLTADLTLPRLYLRRFDAAELPEAVKDCAKQARALLRELREGRISLRQVTAPETGAGVYLHNSRRRRFSTDLLERT